MIILDWNKLISIDKYFLQSLMLKRIAQTAQTNAHELNAMPAR